MISVSSQSMLRAVLAYAISHPSGAVTAIRPGSGGGGGVQGAWYTCRSLEILEAVRNLE